MASPFSRMSRRGTIWVRHGGAGPTKIFDERWKAPANNLGYSCFG